MRWVALALTATVVVLTAVAWRSEEHARTPARAPGAEPPAETAPAPPAPRPEPAEEAAEEPEPGPIHVRFNVGFFGSERAVGCLKASVCARGRNVEAIPVSTEDGTFELMLPRPGRYYLCDVEIDGEEIPEYRREFLVTKSTTVEIRVPEAREVTLVVVDARNQHPLPDVAVYDYRGEGGWGWDFDGGCRLPDQKTLAAKPRRTDGAGRLALGKGRGAARLYLFAESYAWTAVSVPFDAGHEIVVELERGGRVRLLVPGWNELPEPGIWVRRAMTTDDFRVPPPGENGELLLDGLCADDHVFTVRRGEPWRNGKVYGTGEVSVRAGETVELTMHVKPEVTVPDVRVTGTVTVPATWVEPPFYIAIRGVGKATAGVASTLLLEIRPYRFRTGPIPPGRYVAVVTPYMWSQPITVSDHGGHFDFDLPHPVTLRVAVVDAATGRPIPSARLFGKVAAAWTSEEAGPPKLDGRFVVQVAPGTARLWTLASGYVESDTRVAASEDRDVTVRLRKAGIVVVRLRLDGRPFDGAGAHVTVERPRQSAGRRFVAGVARFDTLEPGDHEVRLSDVAGCTPVPPQRIEVEAGRTHEVVFELERKPVPDEAER
ncbi:MAG: hypothetical protein ACYTGI_09270 [Planctomycetota bacterium]|jgi:hypothetical protein